MGSMYPCGKPSWEKVNDMLTTSIFGHPEPVLTSFREKGKKSRTNFSSEARLVSTFESFLNQYFHNDTTGYLTEFDCSNGIADLVLYEFHHGWDKLLPIGSIPPRWVYALRYLPYNESFSTAEFVNLTGVSRQRALKALRQYTSLGYCSPCATPDTWEKIRQLKPVAKNFYAIEAKLRDWKRALSQANRYREYAAQSWVLLDEYAVQPALSNLDRFKRLNIGLASITQNGQLSAYFIPKPTSPKSDQRYWQANAEIARRVQLLL